MVFYRWWKPEVDIDVKFGTSGDQFYWWRKTEGTGENHRPVASH
jgi:hypothetical protein